MQTAIFIKTDFKSQKGDLMENKGLCSTCVYDADCSFNRIFPIVECEEFSDIKLKQKEGKNQKQEEGKSN